MRIKKTKTREGQKYQELRLIFQESIAHGLSEAEPLRFHITMHRGTAPNHIHIFIRLISSDSDTFCRHRTFIPSLDKVSANDRPLYTQIGSNACILIRIDSRFSNLAFSTLLCTLLNRDIRGITGKFSISSSINMSDALTLI